MRRKVKSVQTSPAFRTGRCRARRPVGPGGSCRGLGRRRGPALGHRLGDLAPLLPHPATPPPPPPAARPACATPAHPAQPEAAAQPADPPFDPPPEANPPPPPAAPFLPPTVRRRLAGSRQHDPLHPGLLRQPLVRRGVHA